MIDRIEHAPRAYLLGQDAPDVARQAAFVEPVPSRATRAWRCSRWNPAIGASRWPRGDRPGLLATISAVLADSGLDVIDATVATWVDGAALDLFLVQWADPRADQRTAPDPVALQARIVAVFGDAPESLPNPDADLRFDDHASPWYTICEVRSLDRRGLLRTLTAAMATASANVHSARLVTIDNAAVDRFELTDRNGRKLDDAAKTALIDAVNTGVTRKRKRFRRRA